MKRIIGRDNRLSQASQFINEAGRRINDSYSLLGSTSQNAAQISAQLTQDAIKRNEVVADTTSRIISSNPVGKFSNDLGLLSKSLANLSSQFEDRARYKEQLEIKRQEMELAQQKARMEYETEVQEKRSLSRYTETANELSTIDARVFINEGKEQEYWNTVYDLVNNPQQVTDEYGVVPERPLTPEHKERLMATARDKFYEATRQRNDVIYQGIEELNEQQVRQAKQTVELNIMGTLAQQLKNSRDYLNPTSVIQSIGTRITELRASGAFDNLTESDWATIGNDAFELAIKAYGERFGESQELLNAQASLQAYQADINELKSQLNNGEINYEEYQFKVLLSQERHQVPNTSGDKLANPNAAIEAQIEREENLGKLRQLQYNGINTSIDAQEYSDIDVGIEAFRVATDPGYRAIFENDPRIKDSVHSKRVLAIADFYEKSIQNKQDITQQSLKIDNAIAMLNASTANAMLSKLQQDDSIVAQLQAFGVDTTSLQMASTSQNAVELQEAYLEWRNQSVKTLNAQRAALQQQLSRDSQILERYHLQDGAASIEAARAKLDQAAREADILTNEARSGGVMNNDGSARNNSRTEEVQVDSFFNTGRGVLPNQTLRSPKDGWEMATPFAPGTEGVQYRDGWGSAGSHRHSRSRNHGGIDITAPLGTPLTSVVNGTVVHKGQEKNLGYFVDIRDDDTGLIIRFAHMAGEAEVNGGDRVTFGSRVGQVGKTGNARNTPPHVHLEVRHSVGGRFESTIDADAFLRDVANTQKQQSYQQLPKNSYVGSPAPNVAPSPSKVMPNDKSKYKKPDAAKNYGHGYLAKNDDVRREFNKALVELDIPGEWLADLISLESGWDSKATNSNGCVGFIQFCPRSNTDDRVWLHGNVRTNDILSMSPSRQIKAIVEYLKPYKNRIKSPAHLAAIVFGGEPLLRTLEENPSAAANKSDGYVTLGQYLEKMGRMNNRVYSINGFNDKSSYFVNKY